MKSKIFLCQNPGFCKKKKKKKKKTPSTVFDEWIDCIHDCIHDSTIQMDTNTDTDGYRYRYKYRWIQIQINTDGYRYILSKFLDFQDFCYVMLNACLD